MVRNARPFDTPEIWAVINDGASAYKGVIPADRWHEPYMPLTELQAEIDAGVRFSCAEDDGRIVGVMGVQDRGAVVLVRHAYVRTAARRRGIGSALLTALLNRLDKPCLIGTWRAAVWAIDFYGRHGFRVLPDGEAQALLRHYWTVPERQMATSVVLADRRYTGRSSLDGPQPS